MHEARHLGGLEFRGNRIHRRRRWVCGLFIVSGEQEKQSGSDCICGGGVVWRRALGHELWYSVYDASAPHYLMAGHIHWRRG